MAEAPFDIVDPHHHFFAPSVNPDLHVTLGLKEDYTPQDYKYRNFLTFRILGLVLLQLLP